MRQGAPAAARVTLAALALGLVSCSTLDTPRIDLVRGGGRDVFEVRGLEPGYLRSPQASAADWSAAFKVFVAGAGGDSRGDLPPMLGSARLGGDVLRFQPTFPLEPGLSYRARLEPGPWCGREAGREMAIERVFALAPRALEPRTVVEQVYPTAAVLPENQLKFYIQFSGPMRRGQAYDRIRLLDGAGREVEAPFLELGEELWDPSGSRFTLFFDPGRVKRGLKPREEVGPSLDRGKTYALVIDRAMLDADGAPLRAEFRKEFRAGDPDYEPPDPGAWTLSPPAAGTTGPLVVAFPEPMDQALLRRLLCVRGPEGGLVDGEVGVGRGEREWRFQPGVAWKSGRHELIVDKTLEDLAGNGVGRRFEVDASRGIEDRIRPGIVKVPFEVKAP